MNRVTIAFAVCLLMAFSYLVGRHHAPGTLTATAKEPRVLYWVDPMHPDYKSDHAGIAPDCGMQLEPVYANSTQSVPQVASVAVQAPGTVAIDASIQQDLGIQLARAEKSDVPQSLRVLGRVVPEDTRVYRIDSGTEGYIRETFDDSVGMLVKKDQKLATCYGPEYLSIASGFLAATAAVPGAVGRDGSHTMPLPGALSKQGVSSVQGYTDRLRNLGMSEQQIREIAQSRQLPETIDIVAPADGFILSRNITPGQHFDRSMEFYRIADLSRVWIEADLFGLEAEHVHAGAMARVTLAAQGQSVMARVTKVLPQIDPATRTLKLRLEADNPKFALRPDMFVDIDLPVAMPAGLTIPVDAVIDSGREQRVYVETGEGQFEPRRVQTGWHFGDRVEIVQGLTEGEQVVAEGTFLVDSESRLKFGVDNNAQHDISPKAPSGSMGEHPMTAHMHKRSATAITASMGSAHD